jgi:hypothetical protein
LEIVVCILPITHKEDFTVSPLSITYETVEPEPAPDDEEEKKEEETEETEPDPDHTTTEEVE